MKIVVLLSRVPYPLEKGDKLRAYHQIKYLSKNHDIHLFCLSDIEDTPEAISELSKYCKKIKIFKLSKFKIAFNLFKAFFGALPYQVAYFYDTKAQQEFNEYINATKPDRIFCQLVRTAEYVRSMKSIRKTLDYMDVLSMGIERRVAKTNFLLRPLYKQEYNKLWKYERDIFSDFNQKVIISIQDQQLIQHPQRDQIKVIPNGVELNFFTPKDVTKTYDLVFTGNMNYPPNVDGVKFIAEQILPLLITDFPNIKILIAGSYPALSVLATQSNHIHVSGWVDDIRECYASAKVFVAPMQIGTGLQNKLLEAMAMKLPCITSILANNALGAKENEEILIAKTADEYAKQIKRLLSDEGLSNKIAQGGYDYVHRNYKWETNCKMLEEIITA